MRLFSESATTRNVLRSSGVSGERSGTRDILPESHRMATGTAGLEAGGSLPVPTARDTFAPASMETYTLRPRSDARPERRYRIDYEGELNPAQHAAATTLEGPVLVVAGAGSGKTRTLVYRVARLVESGINPAQILLLTFTRRAAEEMLRRASMLVGGSCEHVAGGTFHSFANTVLRRAARRLGMKPGFTILDRSDSEDVVNLLRSRAGLDRKDRRFPRKSAIVEIFSMAVNRSTTVPALLEDGYAHIYEHLDDLVRLEEEYRRYKREKDLVDYDDLLVLLRDLLRDQPDVAAQLSRTYRYVMVDEYQDTNRLQAEIVRGLAVAHDNVMAVGDDSQSIYSFRGATFRNIMEFPDLFPGTRIIKLEENYRSTQPILDLANAVIERAAEKHTKILHAERGAGGPPVLVQCADEQAQSRFVCQRILELREEGVPLDEIAVLFRSSFHSFDLELELQRADIPFVKRGGFKFIETAHVKDVLAHLRIVANPRDAVSWHRVLLLLDGVGPKTADDVFTHLAEAPTDSVGDVLAADVEEGLLTLSTIHSAKGLEWHTVFVLWLVDGRFPSYLNLHDGDEVEEERRLLYVAVTRAKDNLYLSYPIDIYDRAAGMVLGQASRFVQDLPETILPGMQVIESGGFR